MRLIEQKIEWRIETSCYVNKSNGDATQMDSAKVTGGLTPQQLETINAFLENIFQKPKGRRIGDECAQASQTDHFKGINTTGLWNTYRISIVKSVIHVLEMAVSPYVVFNIKIRNTPALGNV